MPSKDRGTTVLDGKKKPAVDRSEAPRYSVSTTATAFSGAPSFEDDDIGGYSGQCDETGIWIPNWGTSADVILEPQASPPAGMSRGEMDAQMSQSFRDIEEQAAAIRQLKTFSDSIATNRGESDVSSITPNNIRQGANGSVNADSVPPAVRKAQKAAPKGTVVQPYRPRHFSVPHVPTPCRVMGGYDSEDQIFDLLEGDTDDDDLRNILKLDEDIVSDECPTAMSDHEEREKTEPKLDDAQILVVMGFLFVLGLVALFGFTFALVANGARQPISTTPGKSLTSSSIGIPEVEIVNENLVPITTVPHSSKVGHLSVGVNSAAQIFSSQSVERRRPSIMDDRFINRRSLLNPRLTAPSKGKRWTAEIAPRSVN